MRLFLPTLFFDWTESTVLHIEYRPSLFEPLPRAMCVSSRCMIPHFDIQGHSISVEWPAKSPGVIEVDVNTTASWRVPFGINETADCYILKDSIDSSDLPEDDDDDPLLASSRKCITIPAEIKPTFFELLLDRWPVIKHFYIAVKTTLSDLARFDVSTWGFLILSIGSAHLVMKRVGRVTITGVVRVSYTDPKKSPEYTALPSSKFSSSSLTEASIIKELLERPGYSSFTVVTAHPL